MNLAASRAGATPRPCALRWFDAKWIVLGARVALVVYRALVPLGFLAWHSVRAPETARSRRRSTASPLRFVDSGAMVDEAAKWQERHDEIFGAQAR
jgi:hypothetical protein